MTTTVTTKKRSTRSPEARAAAQKDAHDKLAAQVETLTTSQGWKDYLRAAAAFPNYSINNILLILAQNPDATRVAGYQQWKKMGRQVIPNTGQKALKIRGFRKYREDKEDEDSPERTYYPLLSVFDISQTEVTDPDLWSQYDNPATFVDLLDGEDSGIGDAVTEHLTGQGWTVSEEEMGDDRNGYTNPEQRAVRYRPGLSPAQRAKTLIHEAGHIECGHIADLAEYARHRGRMECEAESVAYVVADAMGLDTSGYSVGYIAGWCGGDVEMVRESATVVLAAAKAILSSLGEGDK